MISSSNFQCASGRLAEPAQVIYDDLVVTVYDIWVSALCRMVVTLLIQNVEFQHLSLPRLVVSSCSETSGGAWELHRRLSIRELDINGPAVSVEVGSKTVCVEDHREGLKGVVGCHDVASLESPLAGSS